MLDAFAYLPTYYACFIISSCLLSSYLSVPKFVGTPAQLHYGNVRPSLLA